MRKTQLSFVALLLLVLMVSSVASAKSDHSEVLAMA